MEHRRQQHSQSISDIIHTPDKSLAIRKNVCVCAEEHICKYTNAKKIA